MTILEKANELGQMIKDSAEMKALNEAEEAQSHDDEAQQLIADFNIKRMNLAKKLREETLTQEEAVKQNNEAFNEMVEKSETIKNYVEAKKAFDKLVNGVNSTINLYIMGEQGGCTHDCHTCGGCH
ncbi:MAG: YlbF family regulator [Clostridiales bacterium]|nr:YlbF family regulator [Clostridiales bacterium]